MRTHRKFVNPADHQPLRYIECADFTRELLVLRVEIRELLERLRKRVRQQHSESVRQALFRLDLERVVPALAQALSALGDGGELRIRCEQVAPLDGGGRALCGVGGKNTKEGIRRRLRKIGCAQRQLIDWERIDVSADLELGSAATDVRGFDEQTAEELILETG